MENAPCCRTLQRSLESGGLITPHTSDHVPGKAPRPHSGGGPGGKGKSQSANSSSMILWALAQVVRRQAAPLKSPATKSTFSSSITARMVNSNFLPMPRFLALLLLMWRDITVHDSGPLGGCRLKEARESTSCMTQPESPSRTFVRQIIPVIVEVDGCDLDIGKESVLVEENRASSVVGHVEPVREKLVVNILNCFLQRDDVPFLGNLLLDGSFPSTSGSWIPVVDAESFLCSREVGHAVVEVIFLRRDVMFSSGCFAELCTCFSNVNNVAFQDSFIVCLHPRSEAVSYEGDVFLVT